MYYSLEKLLEPISYPNQFASFIFVICKKLRKFFNGIIPKSHSHNFLAQFCVSGCTFHILYYLISPSYANHSHLRTLYKSLTSIYIIKTYFSGHPRLMSILVQSTDYLFDHVWCCQYITSWNLSIAITSRNNICNICFC